jgi:hypothetical protein
MFGLWCSWPFQLRTTSLGHKINLGPKKKLRHKINSLGHLSVSGWDKNDVAKIKHFTTG